MRLLVRICEKTARRRARQTRPYAPPLKTHRLAPWRRRFRPRARIISQPFRHIGKLKHAASILIWLAVAASAAELPYFHVIARDAGSWPEILSSIGFESQPAEKARILIGRAGSPASAEWIGRVDQGAILVLEGESPLAESFGFKRGKQTVHVSSVRDIHCPQLPIIWEKVLDLPVMELPAGATVFAHERWQGAPMIAGFRRGLGAVLWVAVSPGDHGYERFPYVLEALSDLGMEAPFRSSRLWAFFDYSYRSRVDLDYFAARWRKSGISALHVAAWHFYEAGGARDQYLKKLIEACHREGILVYAWLELPHVSEKFWDDHPQWREKTALLQDAQLDWRKLMNLTNRDCFRSVAAGVRQLVARFDWDGVNLAELYFESLEGMGNPSRFTPMNADVRFQFEAQAGFDPLELFGARTDAASRTLFLDFRSDLARRMQREWLGEIESLRERKPNLDVVLTYVDDRLDTGMRDAIGADSARVLPLLDDHSFTFLIEDPATVWNLGAQRYRTIAERYLPLTPHRERLAIDLNIVDRYQDVYPTKQQTGTELFQLVHSAAANFARVALYFENSLLSPDLALLPSAAAAVTHIESAGAKVTVQSASTVGLPLKGAVLVDGHPWPASDGETVWLPPGIHSVEPSQPPISARLLRLNGELLTARTLPAGGIEFSYRSTSRAIAVLDRAPKLMTIDGSAYSLEMAGRTTVLLPRGEHLVTITTE